MCLYDTTKGQVGVHCVCVCACVRVCVCQIGDLSENEQ